MTLPQIPTLQLNDGYEMPQLGLGTYKLVDDDTEKLVRHAIELGYRHIDTASFYGNEEAVGKAVRDAIKSGDVTREDLFITTKLWNDQQDKVGESYQESLRKLGLEFLDLYMIHWPWAQRGLYVQAFEDMARLQGMGQLQSLGVANFYEEVLDALIEHTGITPVVNQVELHVGFMQDELRAYHENKGIVTEAWAPLARGTVLNNADVKAIAARHERTSAQVVLNYLLQQGISVIPKTANPERLEENMGAVGFRLTREEMGILSRIEGERLSHDPRTFPGDLS
ncbi:aldo/keto reductase [Corynebacterium cystitidis]|uniref:2,5-diketo-D-gluconate reductase A n=1 Tax=Corynebacterium cystitidis DSM 20524 TaxID=1121357 RepID=A0A1H9WHQ6_9CORY|nr:aldo/keto reductase [Corynebacterium cystitidis]WJY81879.1 putative oxidoreductase [Corynebacterium cystitidis DSM 20524]SES33279.1 2,5-diketo-D-gluconate reductase A [Corynebacterium cystitidis DSM 20524]SNV82512.1 putative oxidoreductase [Corynebacterium cystitidis]